MEKIFYCPVCLNVEYGKENTTIQCSFCRAQMVCSGLDVSNGSIKNTQPFVDSLEAAPEFNKVLLQARLEYLQTPEQKEKRRREAQKRKEEYDAMVREARYHVKQCPGTGGVRCPHCNSDQISTGARGWKWTTGFIGSGKTVNRCANCGYTWTPTGR